MHFQHIICNESVDLLRKSKIQGLKFTSETYQHYFIYSRDEENLKVNPPLGHNEDIKAIKNVWQIG